MQIIYTADSRCRHGSVFAFTGVRLWGEFANVIKKEGDTLTVKRSDVGDTIKTK